jgi:hypothetical protein
MELTDLYSKTRNAIHPCTQLFGDIWGKNYPDQKKMIDTVIHYLRTKKFMSGDIKKLLLPPQMVISERGLNLDWSPDLVSDVEDSLLNEIIDERKILKHYVLEYSNIKDVTDVISLTTELLNRNKTIKPIKDTIKNVTSYRITSVYAPYKGKNRDKARKKPIKELIEDIKGSSDYASFNPSVWVKLIGVTPITALFPATEEEWKKFDEYKDKFIQACVDRGLRESTANQIAQKTEQIVRLTKQ